MWSSNYTQFYFPIEMVEDVTKKIDTIMKDIKWWMMMKKLKLNEDKTECMLFGTVYAIRNMNISKELLLVHRPKIL